jgi:hypothetical protein
VGKAGIGVGEGGPFIEMIVGTSVTGMPLVDAGAFDHEPFAKLHCVTELGENPALRVTGVDIGPNTF